MVFGSIFLWHFRWDLGLTAAIHGSCHSLCSHPGIALLGLWALPRTHPDNRPVHSQQKRIAVAQLLCLALAEHVSAFKIMRGTCENCFSKTCSGKQRIWWTFQYTIRSIPRNRCHHDVHVLLAINRIRERLKVSTCFSPIQKIQVTGPGGNPLMCTAVDGISPSPGHAPVAPGTPAAPMEGGPSLAYRLESQHTARRCSGGGRIMIFWIQNNGDKK